MDQTGLHVDPDKVQAILNIPIPTTVKEVRRFNGTTSWYRRFINDDASIIAPLTELVHPILV